MLRLILVLAVCGSLITYLVIEVVRRQSTPAENTSPPPPANNISAPANRPNLAGQQVAQPGSSGLLESVYSAVLSGDWATAEETLAVAEIETLRLRGVLAFRRQDFSAALDFFEKVVENSRSGPPDWINLASSLGALGRWEEAIAAYDKARTINPDDDYSANRYYLALLQSGQRERASQEVAAALQVAPAQSLSQVALTSAVLAWENGQKSKAEEYIRAAQSLLNQEIFQSLISEPPLASLLPLLYSQNTPTQATP